MVADGSVTENRGFNFPHGHTYVTVSGVTCWHKLTVIPVPFFERHPNDHIWQYGNQNIFSKKETATSKTMALESIQRRMKKETPLSAASIFAAWLHSRFN